MPNNFLLTGLIRLILPQAKIVHARRLPALVFLFQAEVWSRSSLHIRSRPPCAVLQPILEVDGFLEQCYSGSIHHLDYESLVLESEEECLLDFVICLLRRLV